MASAPTSPVRIFDRASLAEARNRRDGDLTVIEFERLVHRNLLPCALKYGLWSLREGGRLVLKGRSFEDPAPGVAMVSANLLRQWVACFIGRDVEWVEPSQGGLIELVRTKPVLEPGWSAGVVFSGQDSEIPTLLKCLDGLLLQPELAEAKGGEILVCGPAREIGFLSDYPKVRYVEFPSPAGGRFFIGRKKNALMRAMRGPRMAILHARVVLEAGALAGVPREFDISSPNTAVLANGVRQPYLSLVQSDRVGLGHVGRRPALMMRHFHQADPLRLQEEGNVFVDGGGFFVTREVFEACPLHDLIAWNEAEDVEWCGRAHAHGFLVDLAPASPALSQTNKLLPRPELGRVTLVAKGLARRGKTMAAVWRDRIEKLAGRR